ncbi:methionyl-tRNA formyltransferase [Brumimicrobium aurantiacum]|uniref:Methionyl-tRNA formyltransferase n=1 Tax=Brumimicrobium aurantiacum TaxID=1737063 RepID=A0A3E1EZF7_9FLAO|nr:methionyl-tRNA formyltransferase [Brumimicrobium aurantiacum]RFC54950.1 methionyl-tRNA formyltransferase [Brumimicrobium aurantiacum]
MKEKKDLNIVFMGTPEFAVTILEKLIKEEYNIKAVVTAPDRPAGRGRKLKGSAVKECAIANDLPVLQPTSLKDESFIEELKQCKADLFIVVAFRMLPEIVWKIPAMGTFNLHGSLLPQYRGAAPINWAVINGETETGVTTFFIDEKIDTGEILKHDTMTIGENETAGQLHDRMMVLGAQTVVDTVEMIRKGEANPQPQSEKDLKLAPKISKQDCLLDLDQAIVKIHNFIRGMSPYPTAWIKLQHIESKEEKTLKIFSSEVVNSENGKPLKLIKEEKKLLLTTPNGALDLKEVQLQGKKRLDAKSFLAGFPVDEWQIITE